MRFHDLFGKLVAGVFCSFLFFFFVVNSADAQTNALRINTTPKHPGPFESVIVDVEDFSIDLNKVEIAWTVDGKVMQRGVGIKRLQFTTGALGTVSNISINMGGDVRQMVIRPTVTDLQWQADTHTPPFYKGKALHSNQDPITVVAEPFFINSQGVRLDPTKLIYKWKQNEKLDNNASGYGKKTFRVIPSVLMKPIQVEVEVTTPDNTYHSLSSINISDTKTEVLLYENHPLYGITFEKALNGKEFSISGQEIRVIGMPLFFSNEQKRIDQLAFDWKLNDSKTNQPGNEIIFRKPEGSSGGRSLVGLGVKNPTRFAQSSNSSFYITFQDAGTSPAGQTVF